MYANLKFIQESFVRFNQEIFNGMLPDIALRVGNSRRTFGSLRFKRVNILGGVRCSDFVITISNRLDLPESVIEDTIIHEMIHLYIHYNQIKDTSAHGRRFCTMMKDINRIHGRHITVSHRSTDEEASTDRVKRWHYILVSSLNSGQKCITLCARMKIFEFNRNIASVPEVRSWDWYVSSDSYFNSFPRSRTLKFYILTEETRLHLAGARRCRCENGKFFPA